MKSKMITEKTFNMDKIVSITQVKANDKISEYDLATEFK